MKRIFSICLLFALFPAVMAFSLPAPRGSIALVQLTTPINPIAVRYLDTALSKAKRDGAALAVIEISPEGGNAAAVSQMVSRIQAARIPVLVRVLGTAGADSPAGYLERAAAHLQGVTPAAPTLTRAPGEGVVAEGASATGLTAFLSSMNGKTVVQDGARYVLHTDGMPIISYPMSGLARAVSVLLNPNIAYALLILGILGIALEMSLPGVGLPGIVGGLSFLISLIALGMLSANLGGILIVVLGFVLLIIDIKAPTHGILTAGGLVALLVGSFLLFPSWRAASLPGLSAPHISSLAIIIGTSLLGTLFAIAISLGVSAQERKVVVGKETLVGLCGTALTDLAPDGVVRVATEEWSAKSVGDEIRAGEEVDVVGVEGVHLVVMHRL